jgi:hypothetical protein
LQKTLGGGGASLKPYQIKPMARPREKRRPM